MEAPLIEREAPQHELPATLGGTRYTLAHPASLSFEEILSALSGPGPFVSLVLGDPAAKASSAQLAALRDRWVEHFGLLSGPQLARLHWLVSNHFEALEYDFAAMLPGQSIYNLWHDRQWRTLLNLVDHLPRHSNYSAAVSNDPEYAKMIATAVIAQKAEAEKSGKKPEDSGPPLTVWTPEYEAMTAIHDELRSLSWLVMNQKAKIPTKQPKPLPRPSTAITRALVKATAEHQQSKHDERVAMLLPHKRG